MEISLEGRGFDRVDSLNTIVINGVETEVVDVVVVSESQIDVTFTVPAEIDDGIYDVTFEVVSGGDERPLQSRILLLGEAEERQDLVMTATAEVVATASAMPTNTPTAIPSATPSPEPIIEVPSVADEPSPPAPRNTLEVAPVTGVLVAGTATMLWLAGQFLPRPGLGVGRQAMQRAVQQADRTVRLSSVKLRPKADRGQQALKMVDGAEPWAAEFSLSPKIDHGQQSIEVDGPLIDDANEEKAPPQGE